jgi:hypothetical protein
MASMQVYIKLDWSAESIHREGKQSIFKRLHEDKQYITIYLGQISNTRYINEIQ